MTFLLLLTLVTFGAYAQGFDLRRFVPAFTIVFAISYLCWLAGHYAYIAQTPDKRAAMGIAWSLGLTGEAGYVIALLAGLLIGNCIPGLTAWLKEAARPEWYIKTAIVILGASLGVKAAGATGLDVGHHVPRPGGDHRGVPDLLGPRLLHRPQVFPIQPGMGGAAGVGHLDLRRVGGHHHRGGHPGPADRADHGVVAGRDLLGGRAAPAAVRGPGLPVDRAAGRRRLDGAGGQDRRQRPSPAGRSPKPWSGPVPPRNGILYEPAGC